MYGKILVPLDGSELAEAALQYSAVLATKLHSRIIVFSVCNEGERIERPLKLYLDKVTEDLYNQGIETISELSYGNPADQIIDFAEKANADLVVMSSHGHGGTSRWRFGGVSSKVMNESYIPLLLIRTSIATTPPPVTYPTRILVPLDGSELSEISLQHAIGLAAIGSTEIVLFRVDDPTELDTLHHNTRSEKHTTAENRNGREQEIRDYLARLKSDLGTEGVLVHTESTNDKPAEGIIKYAESHEISMIAITSHGSSQQQYWAFGSVANKVVQGTSRPILLSRPRPCVLSP